MEYIMDCWNGCGEEFVVHAPDRQDPKLTDGVPVVCTRCDTAYAFTVDGDGEPSLDSADKDALGENITGHGSEDATHY